MCALKIHELSETLLSCVTLLETAPKWWWKRFWQDDARRGWTDGRREGWMDGVMEGGGEVEGERRRSRRRRQARNKKRRMEPLACSSSGFGVV